MAQQVPAFLGKDGQLYKSENEADFADYTVGLNSDIRDFLREEKIEDTTNAITTAIRKWELWRIGGFAGWLADRDKSAPAAPAPEPPTPKLAVVESPAPKDTAMEVQAPVDAPVQTAVAKAVAETIAPTSKPPHRRRVAVVGLANMFHRQIERAFGDAFRLTLYDAHEGMAKLESMRAYHKVIVMGHGVHPKTKEILKRIGADAVYVSNGSVDALHDKLTEIWVSAEEP